MYKVIRHIYTKLKNPAGQFGDVPIGVFEDLNVEEGELANLIEKGDIIEVATKAIDPVKLETESGQDNFVKVDLSKVEVPYTEDEHIVLVEEIAPSAEIIGKE